MNPMRMKRVLKPVAMVFATLVVLAGAMNFLWVLGANSKYGGGAMDGYVRDGHYYLAQHGTYTEVSKAIWQSILPHEQALFFGFPFVFACFGYIMLSGVFPILMGLRRGDAVIERVSAVEASGPILIDVNCSGSVAGVGYGFPGALGVAVHPAGLTLRVGFEPRVAILKEELRSVNVTSRLFGLIRVEIDYRSPDIQGPLKLSVSSTSDISDPIALLLESAKSRANEQRIPEVR